ncbi:hypothetical protein KEM55_004188 [Ascosphaera atra]|nr:hypothetical protein KEM55_004188 [Ascosphaera atra]
MTSKSQSLRHQVLGAYKELLFLGRNYPAGYQFFRDKLHDGFARQRHLTDEDEIRKKLAGAEYIKKGMHELMGQYELV